MSELKNNHLEEKIVLNRIDPDSIIINRKRISEDYTILHLSVAVEDGVKYINFQSYIRKEICTDECASNKIVSTYQDGRSDYYIMFEKLTSEEKRTLVDNIINKSSKLKGAKKIDVKKIDISVNNYFIIINLFLNSINTPVVNGSGFLNTIGTCSNFIEESKKDEKIRFLDIFVDKDLYLINNVTTYMQARYYYKNTRDPGNIKEKQGVFSIDKALGMFIEPYLELTNDEKTNSDKAAEINENLYVRRSFLNRKVPSGKASVKTHSFAVTQNLTKVDIIKKVLERFEDYFADYISFDFEKINPEDYTSFFKKDLKKYAEKEGKIVKDILRNKKIIFLDAICDEFSDKWISEQIEILTKGVESEKRDPQTKEMKPVFTDIFGCKDEKMFLLSPSNIFSVPFDKKEIKDENSYYILVTKEKDYYENSKETDPYIKKHNGYIIQTQNIKTELNKENRDKRQKDKSIIFEYSLKNYDIIINKDIIRQTLYSLIIEESLRSLKTDFCYSENITFFKVYKFETSENKEEEICCKIDMFNDGTLAKEYISKKDISNKSNTGINSDFRKVFAIYSSYYSDVNSVECVIKYNGDMYTVLTTRLSALPDYSGIDYLIKTNQYMAKKKKEGNGSTESSVEDADEFSKKNLNRAKKIVLGIWAGYYDLHTFYLGDYFYYLPANVSSNNTPRNLQNAPVGRCIIPSSPLVEQESVKDLFDQVLAKDFGYQFLNNLKIPSSLFGAKLLNEYYDYIAREVYGV